MSLAVNAEFVVDLWDVVLWCGGEDLLAAEHVEYMKEYYAVLGQEAQERR